MFLAIGGAISESDGCYNRGIAKSNVFIRGDIIYNIGRENFVFNEGREKSRGRGVLFLLLVGFYWIYQYRDKFCKWGGKGYNVAGIQTFSSQILQSGELLPPYFSLPFTFQQFPSIKLAFSVFAIFILTIGNWQSGKTILLHKHKKMVAFIRKSRKIKPRSQTIFIVPKLTTIFYNLLSYGVKLPKQGMPIVVSRTTKDMFFLKIWNQIFKIKINFILLRRRWIKSGPNSIYENYIFVFQRVMVIFYSFEYKYCFTEDKWTPPNI